VHGVVDAAKDEKTDPYLSQGLQQMGVDQTVANRIDTGVGLTAGLVAGGPGAVKLGVQGIRALNGVRVAGQAGEAFTVAQVAGAGGKVLAGAGSTAMLADMSYAQGSYVVTGEMKTPLGTQGLMKMGLSETQANYVQVLGGLGVGAGASTVKWAAPKVKAATTARNATAGAAATQVVAGQQGATAPGTAPAGTTGTTTTGTTTTTGSTTTGTTTTGTGAGTTTTGTPTGTTPAGTTPAGTPPVNNTPASGNNTAATGNQSTGSGSGVNAPDLQTKTGGAKPRGNVYNDTLVLGNNLSSEKIFQQGAVLQGADTTVNALTAAVKKKGDAANVVIATGRSDAKGVLDAGGPASAAHTGRAMRIYAEKELGARITPTYVVDRQNMPLMRAALEAAGETPDAYKLVTFNARGRWAEGRSRAFTKKHDPDLMVAVDVPGRTGDRQYLNADGGQITKFNSARDRLFTEAENRGVPTVAALERGHEVGGGAKSVFNRVDPAANGTEIASVVPAGVPVVAGKASWASYALSTELLRRADALDQAPSGKQVRDTVAAVESAGGRSSANTSPVVEGTVAELLKSQAARMGENKPVGPDLRGRTIRVGVFDSGSGGILGADVIKASIEQRTGATVELVPAGDHGAGTYGPKTKTEIADLTRSGLETLEKSDVDLVVMACNTACTSGKPLYAAGIRVPVIDLILSTREYHKTLVGQGKKVVAFSTEATAKLDLPKEYQVLEGLNQEVKIYEDTHVTPVGGTDGPILNEKTKAVTNPKEVAAYDARWAKFRAEYEQRTGTDMSKVAGIDQSDLNLANLVNRYLPDKASPELTARLEFAADHYVDKILKAAPDTDTISWCCTHYPELKPFVQKALDARGKGSIEMVNPMEFHALKAIDELAVQPPGVGISRGGTVAITTAVPDKVAAAKDPSIPAERRTMDIKDVADTVPVVIQQPERPIVGLPRFGRDVDNTPVIDALKNLNRNTIDELRAYDPPGRARSIIISDSPAFAADQLMQSQKPMVVTGIPVRVGRGNKYRPDSDGIKGAAEMASALRKLGKDPVVVTSDAGVAAMKAALQAHGHDDIQVVGFGHRASDPATAKAADNLLQKHGVDSVVGIEVAGRDAAGKYWSADGQALNKVPALDEMFLAAERRNGGAAPGQKIPTIAILDRGNEAGAGKYPNRVPEAASGQKITSAVSADTVVTSGVSSWGASSVVATLESVSGKRGLLTDPASVNKVMHAIADNGAVDAMTGQRGASSMGYSPLVHQGMAELFQKAAAEPPGTKAATPKGPTTTPPSAGTPLPGKPAKTTTGGVPVNEAAFTGRDWPSLWKRLASRDIIDGDGTAYVYQVKPKSGAQAFDGVSAQSFGKEEIAGWGRVAGGTSTVRWYGRTNPGQGLMGMVPRAEMASKLGAQQDLASVGWMLKDRTTGKVVRTTTPPSAEVLADTNIRVTRALARGPKEANVQPNDTYFVVSNRSPQEVMAAGGLREVPLGDTQFKVATAASTPKLPTGWSRARSLKVQAGLTLVAMGGSFGLHAMGFDYGNKVPDGAYGLPPNPLASGQDAPPPEENALVRDLSPAAQTALTNAKASQKEADKLRLDPAADKAAADAAQAKADKEWTTFSKESEALIQQDVKAGKSAFESANAIRNGLKQGDSLDASSDAAVQLALRTSGKLTGGEADVKAALEYAGLVAKDPAFVNDPTRRPLAQRDPLGFARATLMEQGVLSKEYTQAVDASIEKVGQQQAHKSIIAKLLADDVVGAGKEAKLALDAMPNDAARKRVAAELAPLFEGEREHALNALKDKPLSDKGDYLMQYRDAPPEVAQPMAQAVADKFGDFSSQVALQGGSGGSHFIAGLSTLAQAADARSATPQWSERFAAELAKKTGAEGGTGLSPTVLRDGTRLAVEAGQAKLATELANALDKQAKDNPAAAAARDAVLEGATDGLKKQQEHLKEAIGNLTGEAGVNAAGSSLAYYVQNFGGSTPESQAAAVRDYRRINPEVAYDMDQAERVIGERGAALYAINQDLKDLNLADRSKGAALELDKENANLFSEDPAAPSDAEVAMGQSAQLRQELLSRAKQNVPEPRTMIESVVNPTMFITRHISGTTRMTWTLAADANFNAMVADPESFPKRWDALKVRTEKMALSMGVPPDEAKKGIKVVDDYLAAVKGIDPALSDAQKTEKLAKAYADLDKGIKGVSGVGAKTVYNVANAHTPFGQTLRWVANAGFITHNISTPITNFRPMLDDGAINSASGASRIYQATQPPFVLKAYTAAQQHPSMASQAIQAGRAADPEGLLPWKFTFGAGTLGVGIADTALGVVQYKKVPDWVTFTNYGMGVSGIVDGGTGLWNTTAGVLAKNGAVELGAKTIASEIGTIGGYGVALFTGIKSGYNIIHYYDKVDAREAQRDPALKNVLLARGFTENQTKTLLDASTAGESPMVALNAAFARQGMTREQGLAWLKKNFTDEALAAKPGYQDGVDAANTLLANHLDQKTGELPDTDPEAAHAGELRYSPTGVEMRRTPDSVEGLVTYLERFYGPLNAQAAMAPAKSEMKVPKPGTAPPVDELPLPPIANGNKPPYTTPLAPMRTITVDSNSIATGSLEGIAYSNRQHLPDQDALKKAADRGALALRIEALQQLVQINPLREFDLSRLDGVVAARPKGDPDYLEDGWQINVGRR
jgi:glutamate racemase